MKNIEQYSLSHAQKRIWYSEIMHPNTSFANLAGSVVFNQSIIDIGLLKKSINIILENYDALRIRLVESAGNHVKQYVSNYNEQSFEIIEEEQLNNWMLQQSRIAFSLIDSDLFKFALFKFHGNKYGYYFKYHHIIFDALSVAFINKQIYHIYCSLANGVKPQLEVDMQAFTEFLEIDKQYIGCEQYYEDKAFWLKEFKEIPDTLYKNNVNNISTERLLFKLDPYITENINSFCEINNTTLFRFFMSVFYIYFFRITSSNHIAIATGHHNRRNKKQREAVGMTVSTLAISMFIDANMEYGTFLRSVTEKISDCLTHQSYPYDLLVSDLRDKGLEPGHLLNIMLNHIPSLTEDYEVERFTPGSDLSLLNIKINPNQIQRELPIEIGIDFRLELFNVKDIERLFARLLVLIKDIIKSPKKKLCDLEILPNEEKDCILNKFNNTFIGYDENRCFHEYFSEQAIKTPNNIALVYKGQSYSYSKLDRITNQLAKIIRAKGIKPESRVGIITEQSADFVIGILAILKAGATYVPIDSSSPVARTEFIIKDADIGLLLNPKSFIDLLDEKDNHEINNVNKPTDNAYIIYTSGTTGSPKGVMIEHRSLMNFCKWYKDFYHISEADNQAAYCSFTFDVSISELLPPLMVGATVHIIPEEIRLSPREINRYFERENITIASFPTRMGEIFTETTENKSLRILTLAGEQLQKYKLGEYTIVNAYGPTEATIYATVAILNGDCEKNSIGKPLLNTWAYVVDKQQKLLPIGVRGELWISGVQVARGYLNEQELTNEKFIVNPFSIGNCNPVVYKTGDLVKWLPDGNLSFLGRIDGQVKIRGFRVELSEIEYHLLQITNIKEAVVLDYSSLDRVISIQAVVVTIGAIDEEDLKKKLHSKLPDYMIPERILQVQAMPLTQNGKIDRKKLKLLLEKSAFDIQDEMILPKTNTEQKVYAMWAKLLKFQQVGITKNFFDLGGDSLAAISLFVMIMDDFQVNLPVSIIFQENTIEKLARVIDERNIKDNSLVVCIKNGVKDNPLFCIHDISGDILSYSKLATFMKVDEAIYGIRCACEVDELEKSIEALSAKYIEQIKAIHPEGDFGLIGYSSGGIIAYEMARQLAEQKEKVSILVLLDTPNYNKYPNIINNIFLTIALFALSWLNNLSFKDKFKFIITNIKHSKKVKFNMFLTQKSMRILLKAYVPKYYPGELKLFKAVKRINAVDEHLGWGDLVKGIEVYEVDGYHSSIINDKNSCKIAEVLMKGL